MYNSQDITDRIKSLAKEKRISISQMLAECELGKNTVTKMSNGTDILTKNFAKIADYLDCSVDYLLGRTDVPEVNKGTAQIINITPKEEFTGEVAAFGGDIKANPKKKKPQLT